MFISQDEAVAVKVGECEQLVLTYESLARQIALLLLTNGGITRNMGDGDYELYRQLAARRDVVCHMIRVLESELLDE